MSIDLHGNVMLKKQLKRAQMAPFIINLPLCLVCIEAYGSAHQWARRMHAVVPHPTDLGPLSQK